MNHPMPDGRTSVVGIPSASDILASASSQSFVTQDQQDEDTSDCPLLTPSPPPDQSRRDPLMDVGSGAYGRLGQHGRGPPTPPMDQTLGSINTEDGLAFLSMVNSSCKPMLDEPSSRDPMVETSSNSGSSSDTNEPVCTQLLTQLNTAYTHLAPDAQALFYNQDNCGKPPLTGIQLVVPKPPKHYGFMNWNWNIIRKTCFWTLMSLFTGCIALAIGIIATMPKRCDPPTEWWQGSLFYEIFPASFQDSYKNDGIGDFRGIINRLDYLENLGVKGIRLNPIFKSKEYPQHYMEVESLTEVDETLGTLKDFTDMVASIHKRNMTLILDLPIYPFVMDFSEETNEHNVSNRTKREDHSTLPNFPSQSETKEALLSAPAQSNIKIDIPGSSDDEIVRNPLDDNAVTKAIRFWRNMDVDGFYLKGLEHYTKQTNFVVALRYWKSILGPNKIFMCSEVALFSATEDEKNAILNRIDLVDIPLNVANGTKHIGSQLSKLFKGLLFQKAGYPWIHWSTGSVDIQRLASTLKVANASVAIAMMQMMLPGTPNIFYGDEIGMLNSESKDHQDIAHLYQLTPMRWNNQNVNDQTFSKPTVIPWMPASANPVATNLSNLIPKMSKLRSETTPIYVKAIINNNQPLANCDVRYTADEVIIIERRYPRRNTYVFVANLGIVTQTKDLSSLYYAGHVVVGPDHTLDRNIYFKELTILPGEALVIKLDK